MTQTTQDPDLLRRLLCGEAHVDYLSSDQLAPAYLALRSEEGITDEALAPLVKSRLSQTTIAMAIVTAPHPALIRAFLAAHGTSAFSVLHRVGYSAGDGYAATSLLEKTCFDGLEIPNLRNILEAFSKAGISPFSCLDWVRDFCEDRGDWTFFKDFCQALDIPQSTIFSRIPVLAPWSRGCPEFTEFCAEIYDREVSTSARSVQGVFIVQQVQPDLHSHVLLILSKPEVIEQFLIEMTTHPDYDPAFFPWRTKLLSCTLNNHGRLVLETCLAGQDTPSILAMPKDKLAALIAPALGGVIAA